MNFYNIYWHLWIKPDYQLIESLFLQIITIIIFIMSITSIITIILYLMSNKYKKQNIFQIINHWSIQFSISILLLSTILSLSSFILLIYQQNGRYFNSNDFLCKIVIILILIFIILLPIIIFISINSYFKFKKNNNYNIKSLKRFEIKTLNKDYNMDIRHLIYVKNDKNISSSSILLNEKTNEKIFDNNNIIFIANKTRYKLHLLSFIAQFILFITIQFKNYNENYNKLLIWGHKFSKLINEHDYYYAKWQQQQQTHKTKETFESIEWLEYIARQNK